MTACFRCGAALPADGSPCPRCLLELGIGSAGHGSAAPSFVSPTDPTLSLHAAPTFELPPEVEDASRPSALPRFAAGRVLGAYRLVRPLGAGGFGEVWEAEDQRDQRRVALKLLTEELSRTARERFRREGRIAASIHHPRVVFLFSAEEFDGIPALAMELLPGGTLKDLVESSGPLPWRDAVARILELVDGLEAAHAKGILHRDIKPSNCFLDERGEVKIGDFGLSRPTEGGDGYTKTGTYVGTPAFSSPEQVKGAKLDVRSDLFSLGATFYYLLSGKAPFEGETLGQVLAKVLAEQPKPLRDLGIALPRGLERLLDKLLSKLPADRFRDYASLRAALVGILGSGRYAGDLVRRASAIVVDFPVGLFLADAATGAVMSLLSFRALSSIGHEALTLAVLFLYFFVPEALFGRSLGKLLFGLEVRRADGSPLDAGSALRRTAGFVLLGDIPMVLVNQFVPRIDFGFPVRYDVLIAFLWFVDTFARPFFGWLAVSATARKSNGFAGLHELLSRTRTVRAVRTPDIVLAADAAFAGMDRSCVELAEPAILGAYSIRAQTTTLDGLRFLYGVDAQLQRPVWIVSRPNAAAGASHGLKRLQGIKTEDGSWDVYAAPAGGPLLTQTLPSAKHWAAGRTILQGIAEIVASSPAGATFALADFWVAPDLSVLLLPFEPPGLDAPSEARARLPGGALLRQVATFLLEGRLTTGAQPSPPRAPALPLPKADREILTTIASSLNVDAAAIAGRLRARRGMAGAVSPRARRWTLVYGFVLTAAALLGAVWDQAGLEVAARILAFGPSLLALPFSVLFAEGGLSLRLSEVAVVRRDGSEAGPLRRLTRALAAWAPLLLVLWLHDWDLRVLHHGGVTHTHGGLLLFDRSVYQALGLLAVFDVGVVFAVRNPARSLQDRIAGTALVPN